MISQKKLKEWYRKGFIVPLVVPLRREIDLWKVAKRVLFHENHVFFLDSVTYQKNTGRYSFLAWDPFHQYQSKTPNRVISQLRRLFRKYRGRKWSELPFFTGGAVGYFSYELVHAFERLPNLARDDFHLDPVTLLFVRCLVVYDHQKKMCYLISNLIPSKDGSFDRAHQHALKKINQIRALLECEHSLMNGHSFQEAKIKGFKADLSKHRFKKMVLRVKKYIEAGDIYQANLSQRFSFEYQGDAELIYERLRSINPSPFSSFIKIGNLKVVSASPERLIRLEGDRCQTRPIAGTRPRGKNPEDEKRFRRQLIMSPKERAEHIMLVDLERNDLGKVSEPRSVCVNELMTIEQYSHVVHIVSDISGKLKKDCDRFDLLKAVFPGGTITGCPKIRSMEIIEELEPFKRHLYTGSIGYLDFNGDLDLNIVIRSLILKGRKGYLQVGAGIVYDSDPESEYWETLHKGKALLDALMP